MFNTSLAAIRRLAHIGTVFLLAAFGTLARADDAYLEYVRSAPEFQPVKQDPQVLIGRWDTWLYMPWRYQWSIGTGDAGGQFCRDFGINGGFTDHGEGPLDWFAKWKLRFYNDHTAAKGFLFLRDANQSEKFAPFQRDPRAVRRGPDGPHPIDEALLAQLSDIITRNVGRLKSSPQRVAYALDDEISWGVFVTPLPWRLNDDDAAYSNWLDRYYGGKAPQPQYVTPDFVLPQLDRRLGEIDLSPLLDRITYQDSLWANFLGKLVECANSADPDTPCGFVGGQSPNIWGGYDYAKLIKKIQFIEAYNLGSSQAIIRSFNPQNALPQVTTHFHTDQRGTRNDIWQSWYYFAHGNRGMIGWVENWFDGKTPRPWLAEYRETLQELGTRQGPKLAGARWSHDGVALYYSHPSIQVSWCLDIEPHRKTWVNRKGSDHRLGTSHGVRQAWEDLLTDAGLQYSFISYDQVVTSGVPDEYRVLILPACYALSDIEARRIAEFCRRGGTVIADFACGLFDQHGTGRKRGALDDLFGVRHNGDERRDDLFAGKLWVETDQDAGYSSKSWRELLATLEPRMEAGFAVAERRLPVRTVRKVERGTAVYLNLSPLRYLQYREEGKAEASHREHFLEHVLAAAKPRVVVTSGGARPRNCEVTYWTRGGRTYLFVVQKTPTGGDPSGGNWASQLLDEEIPIAIEFATPARGVIDERTGKTLGDGRVFKLPFKTLEAVLLSYATPGDK
jgi:hypothetical protein